MSPTSYQAAPPRVRKAHLIEGGASGQGGPTGMDRRRYLARSSALTPSLSRGERGKRRELGWAWVSLGRGRRWGRGGRRLRGGRGGALRGRLFRRGGPPGCR